MSPESPTFALVMPTLDEIEGLRHVLPRIDRSLFKEIVVVDGGSKDGTLDFAREQGLIALRQPGRGLTDAQEYAFRSVTADVIVLFTPDGNSLPEALPHVCAKIREGYDMVIASRYLEGAKSEDDDAVTAFGNWMFTTIINLLFGGHYTDTLVGFRAYTRQAVLRMELPTMVSTSPFRQRHPLVNSWETGSSLRAARLKLRVTEIPVDEPKRVGGNRKMRVLGNGFGAVCQILYDFVFFYPRGRAE